MFQLWRRADLSSRSWTRKGRSPVGFGGLLELLPTPLPGGRGREGDGRDIVVARPTTRAQSSVCSLVVKPAWERISFRFHISKPRPPGAQAPGNGPPPWGGSLVGSSLGGDGVLHGVRSPQKAASTMPQSSRSGGGVFRGW